MVGYTKNDSLTQNQKFIAGCISGIVTRFVTQPLDVVKLRTQLQKQGKVADALNARDHKWFKWTRLIIKEEGVTALWHGHNLGQVHSILSVTSQFFVYEMLTKYVTDTFTDVRYKPTLIFLSGIIAGCFSATLTIPIEVVRVRQMLVKEQYKGLFNGAREVYNSGGILAFYEGLNASLLQMGPQVGISFAVFSFTQPLILSCLGNACKGSDSRHTPSNVHKPEYLLVASTLAGALSGFISKSVTYPFDLVKRRMQIGSHKPDKRFQVPSTAQNVIKCTKLTKCLTQSYKKEGFFGLYRGWRVTIFKAQVTSVVAFTTYELMCYVFREFGRI